MALITALPVVWPQAILVILAVAVSVELIRSTVAFTSTKHPAASVTFTL